MHCFRAFANNGYQTMNIITNPRPTLYSERAKGAGSEGI